MATVGGTSGVNATAAELYALARQAGFTGQSAVIAVAIALTENPSRATNALNDNPATQDYSIGNWQVNYLAHRDFGTPQDLTNPATNAAAAAVLYNRAGQKFTDWTTYRNNAYLAHMAEAEAVAIEADFGHVVSELLARIGLPASGGTGIEPGTAGNPVPGQDTHVPGQATGLLGAAQAATTAAGAIAAPFAWLVVPGHWWAIAFCVVAGVLVIAGARLFFASETADTMRGLRGFAEGSQVRA